MEFFNKIANKFTEKPGKKLTRCKYCKGLCHGYPVEDWKDPFLKGLFRLIGVTIGSVNELPGGGTIAETVANRLFDTRLKNDNLIVYKFECDNCGNDFLRLMPDKEFYYEPTEEEEKENNKKCRELLVYVLDQE